jgi:dihydrolipoamide dehydrogenase
VHLAVPAPSSSSYGHFYSELGARMTIVELLGQLIPGADTKEIVTPLTKQYDNIYLRTKVTAVTAGPDGLIVIFDGAKAPASACSTRSSSSSAGAPADAGSVENAGVPADERGFIPVDK